MILGKLFWRLRWSARRWNDINLNDASSSTREEIESRVEGQQLAVRRGDQVLQLQFRQCDGLGAGSERLSLRRLLGRILIIGFLCIFHCGNFGLRPAVARLASTSVILMRRSRRRAPLTPAVHIVPFRLDGFLLFLVCGWVVAKNIAVESAAQENACTSSSRWLLETLRTFGRDQVHLRGRSVVGCGRIALFRLLLAVGEKGYPLSVG